ncbi:MAG: HAMP domain-containing histidine kinase [Deltaproteobacteria bacterium]|nr:HAMP domain-containing histidine kinase [Deltaproteobacteria bacterium]
MVREPDAGASLPCGAPVSARWPGARRATRCVSRASIARALSMWGTLERGRLPEPETRVIVRVAVLAAVALTAIASWLASTTLDRPVPSLMLDPFGDFSVVYLPGWGTEQFGLQPGDRVVAVGLRRIGGQSGRRADAVDAAILAAAAAGASSVELELERARQSLRVRASLRCLGADELFWFFALYALMGALLLWSGLAALRAAGRRAGARAYLALTCCGFVFLVTFFDYHTTRVLSPLFAASTFGIAVSLAALALNFPEPPEMGRRGWQLAALVFAGSLLVGVPLMLGPLVNLDLPVLRQSVAVAITLALLSLAAGVVVRLRRAKGPQRRELRSAALGLVLVPVLVAVAHVVVRVTGFAAFHMVLPFVALLIPASVGYALIRHNILGTTAVLTRRLLLPPVLIAAVALGGMAWWVSWETTRAQQFHIVSVAVGVLVCLGTVLGGWHLLTRMLFPAVSHFRPTVLHLGDRLAALDDAAAVRSEVAQAAGRFLPGSSVVAYDRAERLDGLDLSAAEVDRLIEGQELWSGDDPWQRRLYLPLRSAGELLGVLVITPKDGGAPFTDDELTLLRTIAGLGAMALHNIKVVHALDERRTMEVVATREDKRLAVDLIAAEIAHELSYPLTYFRHFLRQLAAGRAPKSGDVEIGQEEVARLERMLASMRKLQIPTPALQTVSVPLVAERARTLLASELDAMGVTAVIEIAADLHVRADPDQLLQLFANLLRNGAQAASAGGRIGVRSRAEPNGGVVLEFWDTGAGIAEHVRDTLFRPWTTGRKDGTGLGLALSLRIARAFGWSIDVDRRDAETLFAVRVPTTVKAPDAAETPPETGT